MILQKVAASGMDWDDAVSDEVKKDWKKWLETSNILNEFCIPCNFLLEHTELRNDAEYQLHGFCDALDSAFSCAIYLRCISAATAQVRFVIGKSKLVLTHQKGWVISRKELEAAKMLSELMLQTSKAGILTLFCLVYPLPNKKNEIYAHFVGGPQISSSFALISKTRSPVGRTTKFYDH